MRISRALAAVAAALLAVSLAFLGPARADAATTNGATIVVGTAVTAPFEYYDKDQQLIGFDVDLMNKIATMLHDQVRYDVGEFGSLIPSLQAGKVNVVIAAMYVTPARRQVVNFATPYLDTGLVMVARPGIHLTSAEDLKGLRVGVKSGSTGQAYLQAHPGATAVVYTDTLSSFHDLVNGRVDVVLNDYLNTLAFLKASHADVQIVGGAGTPVYLQHNQLGIAVPKGDAQLLEQINAALAELKRNGFLEADFKKWLSSV